MTKKIFFFRGFFGVLLFYQKIFYMKSYKLSFGSIFIIRNNLDEIIANEAVVMDENKRCRTLRFFVG